MLLASAWAVLFCSHLLTQQMQKRWVLGVPYSLLMAISIVIWAPGLVGEDQFVRILTTSLTTRIYAVSLCTDFRAALFWNVVHTVLACWLDPSYMALTVMFLFLLASMHAWLRAVTMLGAMSAVDIHQVNSEREAWRMLLASLCDAVVELDSELRISEEAPILGAWLLAGRTSLRGLCLEQFLCSESKHLFFQEVKRKPGEEMRGAAFPLRMRDGSGQEVAVECFHVMFHSGSDERHLLGLREHDEAPPPPAKLALSESPDQEVAFLGHPAPDALVLEFDAATWNVLSASRPFYHKFHMEGPLRQEVFDYLEGAVRLCFRQELTRACNELLHSKERVFTLEDAPLPFLMPLGNCLRFSTSITLHKMLPEGSRRAGGPEDVRGQLLMRTLADSHQAPAVKATELKSSAEKHSTPRTTESGSILDMHQGRLGGHDASSSTSTVGSASAPAQRLRQNARGQHGKPGRSASPSGGSSSPKNRDNFPPHSISNLSLEDYMEAKQLTSPRRPVRPVLHL